MNNIPHIKTMVQYTIYDHPKDFPNHWVVRQWKIFSDGKIEPSSDVLLFDSLEQARTSIPPNQICLSRNERDDPVIYEVWI